ncbi:hypothetical protein SAMN04488542_11032 [Fontibacillus panacisegetis]|uniref:Uncharacterized protein n=1 Tax=Fontibacillus panacisegetis TaxID=670482 RepID=A0A1G7KQY1_9BACL|nr:hypothetical protein [Fontibacillus panacisegetis]SDF39360.1 hypothetical protein SAMN04488542_11032 [Fontibacillus panacisegetis]
MKQVIMKRKHLRIVIWIFSLLLLLLLLYIGKINGYSLTERNVIRNSYPSIEGEVIYQQEFNNNKKLVVWKTEQMNYAKLVETKWGIFHRVSAISELSSSEPNDPIKRTWSAHLNSKKKYDTIFAAEVVNPDIKKVIVSNDQMDDLIPEDLNEIRGNSTLVIELNVKDGFAASYNELNNGDVGNFVFRGLNEKGEIITGIKPSEQPSEQSSVTPTPQEDILYTNNKLGFSLRFPISWKDYYSIVDQDNETGIDVYFIGKSMASKNEDDEYSTVRGLYLFSIASESSILDSMDSLDSISEVGTSQSIKYVSYTGTDCSICILNDTVVDADVNEQNLMSNDWTKVTEMLTDKDAVIHSFESINK